MSQEINQIQYLEPTIVDHESETAISEPSFVITSGSPIAPQSTSSPDPKVISTNSSQLGCHSVCCAQGSPYKPTSVELQKTSVKQTSSNGKNRLSLSPFFQSIG